LKRNKYWAASEFGNIALEYQMYLHELKKKPPHVVMWTHAPNDSQESDMTAVFYQHLPGYVDAACNIDMCNEDLPMVVILKDIYGFGSYGRVNELSGYLSQLSSWYGLTSVNHANVIKHELWANYDNGAIVTHVLGSGYNLHAGMGSHAGVAWTMLFNFLSAFTDSCAAESFGVNMPFSLMPLKFLGAYDTIGRHDPTNLAGKQGLRETFVQNTIRQLKPLNHVLTIHVQCYEWCIHC